jgi:ferritin
MNKRIVDAVNAQIHAEFSSAYVYLAMSARMEELSLPGFANWLRIQWQEEIVHALKLYDFLIARDAVVSLKGLGTPSAAFETPLEAFESVLKHEQKVTALIHELYAVAIDEKDYPLQSLLQWFIDEQVEEEENARAAIDSLRLVGDSGSGLFMLDREMGTRALEPGSRP